MDINRIMPPVTWSRHNIFVQSHVDDLAEGIALAAEKGRPSEIYLLGGEQITMEEAMSVWKSTPGGLRFHFWLPTGLLKAMFWPLKPLQRFIGLPAFTSRETVLSTEMNYNFSSDKARRELGWAPRTARQAWLDTMAAERELITRRNGGGLVSRLRPLSD
jgi:dihydroflavonol-4-reductase